MLNNQIYYRGTTEKAIVAFGNLFKNIYIQRYNADGSVSQTIQVPVSYAPKEKFLAREKQQPDIDIQREEMTLPRLAFEITGFQRDPSRQMNGMQQRKAVTNGQVNSSFNPVPYNLTVTLYALAKTQHDALMIMEQILPVFNPTYTVTLKALPELNMTDELPITLDSVQHEDNYDDAFVKRREIVWTFNFTMQLNYFGYVDTNQTVIKQTEVTFYGQSDLTDSEQLELVQNAVSPFSANQPDAYTVVTTIEGFNGND
jgi:hypothetical protein